MNGAGAPCLDGTPFSGLFTKRPLCNELIMIRYATIILLNPALDVFTNTKTLTMVKVLPIV